jgi:hypothetical protein
MRVRLQIGCCLILCAFATISLGGADADGPAIEPVKSVSVDTREPIQLDVHGHGVSLLRYHIARVRKDKQDTAIPSGMKLDARSGSFRWTPTPSQAGSYEIILAVRDSDDREATTTFQTTVRPRSISAAGAPVGDLLRKWYAEGTAAGNVGDFYDNRDRDHSALHRASFPQLDEVMYTDEERKKNIDWALQPRLLKPVTFGNSSTSAGVLSSGSNVRTYYTHPRGLPFLYEEYRGNNLYIYPAHHDHHPGRNGKPFYGDVFPANTPYLITSQGSSGSDQPFMRAVPETLAAFQPEVKKKLIETGLLMPTVQMILRSTNKHLKEPNEYLTGKAHPPVFEGAWVDDLKMVQMAHDMPLKSIPPMIQLKVIEEDEPVPGKDYFDGPLTEKLADSPAAIARVVRGGSYYRRMVVSAEDSFDANKNLLKFHWSVLRGDRERITIKPLNEAGSRVEIRVPYHERRPVEDAPLKIESNRVDIGAFVHNGTYYSAPGFVTFFYLDNEARAYDDKGRLLERGYGYGETELHIADWNELFALLQADKDTLAVRLIKQPLKATELTALRGAGEEHNRAAEVLGDAQKKSKLAEETRQKAAAALKDAVDPDAAKEVLKKAEAAAQDARKEVETRTKAVNDILEGKRAGLELSVKELIERTLHHLRDDPHLFLEHRAALEPLLKSADAGRQARVKAAQQRLVKFDILHEMGDSFELRSIRPGSEPITQRLTRFEHCLIERCNGEVLTLLYPKFLNAVYKVNFVDQRLFTSKSWRDVYRYESDGKLLGWTRYDGEHVTDFNARGELVLSRDDVGRPVRTRTVVYELDDPKKNIFQSPFVLKQRPGGETLDYEYVGPDDTQGRVVRREKTTDAK